MNAKQRPPYRKRDRSLGWMLPVTIVGAAAIITLVWVVAKLF